MTINPPAMSKFRARLPAVTHGFGTQVISPKKRSSKKKHERPAKIFLDLDARRRRTQRELDELLKPTTAAPDTPCVSDNCTPDRDMEVDHDAAWVDENLDQAGNAPCTPVQQSAPATKPKKIKRLIPDIRSINLYCKWRVLLPTLVEPLLAYTSNSIGKAAITTGAELAADCKAKELYCEERESSVLCLYFDRTYHLYNNILGVFKLYAQILRL